MQPEIQNDMKTIQHQSGAIFSTAQHSNITLSFISHNHKEYVNSPLWLQPITPTFTPN